MQHFLDIVASFLVPGNR